MVTLLTFRLQRGIINPQGLLGGRLQIKLYICLIGVNTKKQRKPPTANRWLSSYFFLVSTSWIVIPMAPRAMLTSVRTNISSIPWCFLSQLHIMQKNAERFCVIHPLDIKDSKGYNKSTGTVRRSPAVLFSAMVLRTPESKESHLLAIGGFHLTASWCSRVATQCQQWPIKAKQPRKYSWRPSFHGLRVLVRT